MKNYSASYPSSSTSNTDPVSDSASNTLLHSKPLITPASNTPQSPKIKVKPPKVNKKVRDFDWGAIFNRTFLTLFLETDDPYVGAGKYDYAFYIGNKRLYLMVQHEDIDIDNLNVPQNVIDRLKQHAATKLTKRFQQLRDKLTLPNSVEMGVSKVYCIGLTALSVYHKKTEYPIDHEYNSQFFEEECVLDLDDENRLLQLFSLGGFIKIMKLLQTPSDTLSYLDFHRPVLVNQQPYDNEVLLAESFLTDPKFFSRAVKVQKKLVDIGLLAKVEDRLLEVSRPEGIKLLDKDIKQSNEKFRNELIEKLQGYALMYQKLVNGVTKRRHDEGKVLPVSQVRLLINESMYTRMSIMEEIVAYANRTEAECRNGYLCHQHSYNHFGHHYVLIVYGIDDDAEYTRESVKQEHENLLMDINSQLQNPVMKEFFVLGFDMSNHDGRGNVTVEIDVFHQVGSAMTLMERRLYEQVQALSSSNY